MDVADAIRQAEEILSEQGIEEVNSEALRSVYGPRLSKREFAELVDDLVDDSQR